MTELLPWAPLSTDPRAAASKLQGGRGGEGVQDSQGPTSWGRVTSELSCSLGEGSRAGRGVSVSTLGFHALLLLLSANYLGQRSCGGFADNGCSHFPAVRYLMTLTPQPPRFFTDLFFSLWHSQLKCFQQPDRPKSWLLSGTLLCQAALSSKGVS